MEKYVIETKNLTKRYGTQKSVSDLCIHVKKGRIYGLLGRSGAGKTTTMKLLLGLIPPTCGEVKIFCDYRGKTILISSHILSEISLLADDIGIIDYSVLLEEELLAIGILACALGLYSFVITVIAGIAAGLSGLSIPVLLKGCF